jgi:hypothetical protein
MPPGTSTHVAQCLHRPLEKLDDVPECDDVEVVGRQPRSVGARLETELTSACDRPFEEVDTGGAPSALTREDQEVAAAAADIEQASARGRRDELEELAEHREPTSGEMGHLGVAPIEPFMISG